MRVFHPSSLPLTAAVCFVSLTFLSDPTTALLIPKTNHAVLPSTSSSSSTALNQYYGTGSSSGAWWEREARVGNRGRTSTRFRNNSNYYGMREVGANNIGRGTLGGTPSSSTAMSSSRRDNVGVREVGPNSIGTGSYGGRSNIRPYESGAIVRSGDRRRSRNNFFPEPSSRRGGSMSRRNSGYVKTPHDQWWEQPDSYNNNNYRDSYYNGRSRYYGSSSARSSTIQGNGSRKTYTSFRDDPLVVDLGSDEGRPIDTEVELWQGPDNTPHRMRFYSQNGSTRPFQAIVDPSYAGGYGSTMQIRNSGPMAFPITGGVGYSNSRGYSSGYNNGYRMRASDYVTIQGGSLRTMTVHGDVDRVRVDLETDGLPLMATIELWQGPGEAMQVAEIYNDCGRPFSTMVETPGGYGSTIAIRNEGPLEFPIQASIAY